MLKKLMVVCLLLCVSAFACEDDPATPDTPTTPGPTPTYSYDYEEAFPMDNLHVAGNAPRRLVRQTVQQRVGENCHRVRPAHDRRHAGRCSAQDIQRRAGGRVHAGGGDGFDAYTVRTH